MSHKIAKAQRKAERNAATPNDMHLLIVESNRQRRRANAHTLKDTSRPHNRSASTKLKGKVRQAKRLLQGTLLVQPVFDFETAGRFNNILADEWIRFVITES